MSTQMTPTHVRSDKEAAAKLSDAQYLAYAMSAMLKLGLALIKKRWPDLA